jgi:hypothetical protein
MYRMVSLANSKSDRTFSPHSYLLLNIEIGYVNLLIIILLIDTDASTLNDPELSYNIFMF